VQTTPFVLFLDGANETRPHSYRSGPYAWDDVYDARTGRPSSGEALRELLCEVSRVELAARPTSLSSARPVPGLAALDVIIGTYANGRVLVESCSDPRERIRRVELGVLDPATGTRVLVPMPVGARTPDWAYSGLGNLASGAVVLGLQWHDDPGGPNYCVAPTRFARITSDGRAQFTALLPGVEFGGVIGCPDESTLLVLRDGRRIVRAKFDGSASEVVFPRAAVACRASTGSGAVGVPK